MKGVSLHNILFVKLSHYTVYQFRIEFTEPLPSGKLQAWIDICKIEIYLVHYLLNRELMNYCLSSQEEYHMGAVSATV